MAAAKALLLTAALAVTTAALFRHGEAFGVRTILTVPNIALKNFASKQRRLGMQSTHDERHGGSGIDIDIDIGGFDGPGNAARHSRTTSASGGLLPRLSQLQNERPKRLAAALLGATATAACLVFSRRCIHMGLAKRTLANAAALAVYGWFCWKTLVSKLQEGDEQSATEISLEPTTMVTTARSGTKIDASQPTPTAATTTTTTTNSYIEIEVSGTILETTSPDLLMSF